MELKLLSSSMGMEMTDTNSVGLSSKGYMFAKCWQLANELKANGLPIEFASLIDDELVHPAQTDADIVLINLQKLKPICDRVKVYIEEQAEFTSAMEATWELNYKCRAAKLLAKKPTLKERYGIGYNGLMRLSDAIKRNEVTLEPDTQWKCTIL